MYHIELDATLRTTETEYHSTVFCLTSNTTNYVTSELAYFGGHTWSVTYNNCSSSPI